MTTLRRNPTGRQQSEVCTVDDGPGRPMGKARVPLTPDEAAALIDAYVKVPKRMQIHHEWQTPAGRELLELIYRLLARDVPLRWIAIHINVDEGMLQQTVNRMDSVYRKRRRAQDRNGER